MGDQTEIEWADMTFNPWEGCQKVGPGCDHCYAEARNARFGGGIAANWGPNAPRRRTSAVNWDRPIAWQRAAALFEAIHKRRPRVFCASLADVFDNAVNPAWRADLAQLIRDTPGLDWLLLTKRIGNAPEMLMDMFGGPVPSHVYLGATVVNQAEWDRDVDKIAAASVIVGHQRIFLSIEPLLGRLNLASRYKAARIIGHVIVGGESGPKARPMHISWVRMIRDQCEQWGIPFLFKQWGEWVPLADDQGDWPIDQGGCIRLYYTGDRTALGWPMQRVGKARAGRLLDGRTHDDLPTGKDKA